MVPPRSAIGTRGVASTLQDVNETGRGFRRIADRPGLGCSGCPPGFQRGRVLRHRVGGQGHIVAAGTWSVMTLRDRSKRSARRVSESAQRGPSSARPVSGGKVGKANIRACRWLGQQPPTFRSFLTSHWRRLSRPSFMSRESGNVVGSRRAKRFGIIKQPSSFDLGDQPRSFKRGHLTLDTLAGDVEELRNIHLGDR